MATEGLRLERGWVGGEKRPGRARHRWVIVHDDGRKLGCVTLADYAPGLLAISGAEAAKVGSLREGIAWLRMRQAWLDHQAAGGAS